MASRSPKAPLPPRVAQPDKVDGSGGPSASDLVEPPPLTIELESSPALPRAAPSAPAPAPKAPKAPRAPATGSVATVPPPAAAPSTPAVARAPSRPSYAPPRLPLPSIASHEPAKSSPSKSVPTVNAETLRTKDAKPLDAKPLAQKPLAQKPRETAAPPPLPPVAPAPPSAAPPPLLQAFEKLHKKRGESGGPSPPSSRPALGASTDTSSAPPDSPRRVAATEGAAVVPSARDLAEDVGTRSLPTEMLGSPSPIQPPPAKGTAPVGPLNLKPGTAALSPGRAPAAIAVVGGSSLRINAHAKQGKAGSTPPQPVPGGRPSTAPKGFAPVGGRSPGAYERGFRQWSSPTIATADEPPASGEKAPVTYQVYTAQDISAGRGPMRSMVAIAPEPKKMSLGARVGSAVIGGVVVVLTAAAVIAVSTEDPKHTAPSATVAPRLRPTVSATAAAEPPPTTLSIGDPSDNFEPYPTPVAPTPTVVKPKAKAPPPPPASLKTSSPPPNPYGK